jgi:hypothetical protein
MNCQREPKDGKAAEQREQIFSMLRVGGMHAAV